MDVALAYGNLVIGAAEFVATALGGTGPAWWQWLVGVGFLVMGVAQFGIVFYVRCGIVSRRPLRHPVALIIWSRHHRGGLSSGSSSSPS